MAGMFKKLTDCFSGRDFAQYAKDRGYRVEKNGSYNRVDGKYGTAHIKDCDRAMVKQERNWVIALFIKIGIVGIVALLGYHAWTVFAPYF